MPPAQLSAIITTLSEQLSRCDDEIARLQARINKLMVHRGALREQYVDCQGLSAPIRRLPVEIIAEIFGLSMAVSEQDYIGHPTYPTLALNRLAHRSLLIASQVCARWHSIGMGTPSLWTKIHLDTALWRS
ncbi:hypothetical protein B0H19DRAFT_921989, partial [Mycena capillaripes]